MAADTEKLAVAGSMTGMTDNQTVALTIFLTITAVGVLTLVAGYLMVGMAWRDYDTSSESGSVRYVIARPSAGTLLYRALAGKCPNCGIGKVLKSYFQMNKECSSCGAVFWKNEGEWTGSMLIDFIFALAVSLYTWAALVYFDCSLTAQMAVTGTIAAFGGVMVMPWAHGLWTMFLFVTGEMGQSTNKPELNE
jgi:uncharacterized protein (DUF983 family)